MIVFYWKECVGLARDSIEWTPCIKCIKLDIDG